MECCYKLTPISNQNFFPVVYSSFKKTTNHLKTGTSFSVPPRIKGFPVKGNAVRLLVVLQILDL